MNWSCVNAAGGNRMATVKVIEKNKVQVEFEISAELFSACENKAYQKNKGKLQVPGFRKGHAPKAVLEKHYGEGLFFEEAFEEAFPEAYMAAVKELDLFVVSRPENVDIVSAKAGEAMVVTAQVYVKPEVELCDYAAGVEVEYEEIALTDEAVENDVKAALEANARYEDVERAAAMGDRVIIDYSGTVDGVKFDGGTAEAQPLDLGSNMFIPGFEDGVVGMNVGETKDIEVTFPAEYHEASLAGKAAVFAVTVNAIKEKIVPEANDEFAQDVSEFDTFEEYKADLKEKLQKRNEEQNTMRLQSAIIEKIVSECKVEIPASMVETQIDQELNEMAYNLMYQGMTMEQYFQFTGQTEASLREMLKNSSERRVKTQLVLDAIKEKEAIKATDEDLNEVFGEFAEAQKKSIEDLKKELDADSMEYIENRAAFSALGRYLVSIAKVVAPAKAEEETKAE